MVKLTGMTVEGLMHLRKRVDEALHERRTEIEKQLKMFAVVCSARRRWKPHELDRKSVARVPTLGQVDDLMLVDTEDHLLLTRQLDDEFQLLAGRMHQLDSHIALDLGNFCAGEIVTQEIEAQHVECSI